MTAPTTEVVRVLTDVAAIDKAFDYAVGDEERERLQVGSRVRVGLGTRRVGGWVVDLDPQPPAGVALRPLHGWRGWGPEPDVVELAAWAAWRWAGTRSRHLATASPPRQIRSLPPPALSAPSPGSAVDAISASALAGGATVVRLPPASDPFPLLVAAALAGPTLVVVPSTHRAARLADRASRAGFGVALLPDQWAQARAGARVVIGTRAAAWGPCPGLRGVVVLDGHDAALVQTAVPTWSGTAVALERARRAGVPGVVVSACPSLELLAGARLVTLTTQEERAGWAPLVVVDRRSADPRQGLYSRELVDVVRTSERVVCVLNRTGRARLLACRRCGELARCERCGGRLIQAGAASAGAGALACPRCGQERPVVCGACGSVTLKALRVGVSRVREELAALAGRDVGEVTAVTDEVPATGVLVGTEAVLHRAGPADVVAFLDFDQELLAPRFRAAEAALGQLARASRLVGGRHRGGRVLVQTRLADHPVLVAAARADPGILTAREDPLRRDLRLPPYRALAAISGPGAPDLIGRLSTGGIEVGAEGSGDSARWLVRAEDHHRLADALQTAGRPAQPVRVEVDPAGV